MVIHPNGHNLPVYYVNTVDHRDDAECGIEIENRGTPLAVHYVPLDLDAFYGGEESSENGSHRGCSLNGRANWPRELYVFVKRRGAYIPCSKPVQVRFNSMDHIFPHENSIPKYRKGGARADSTCRVRLRHY